MGICRAFIFSAWVGGCATGCVRDNVTHTGQRAALDSFDLATMTDDMAMKIAGDPDVQQQFASHGPLAVVVRPVRNRLVGEVLPRGQAELFTARVRTLLSQHARGKFTWVMNRETFYRLRDRELEGIDPGPSPDAVNPQYALTATFTSLADEDAQRRSAYYLCVYELTDLAGRTTLWSDRYEVRKIAVKSDIE